jgi:CheY-like chemotaxis protein
MIDIKKKVVVIDDEPDVVVYLSAVLTNNDFEVFTSSNALEGLALIKEQKPDLICLDILMPGKTGISIYREIRKDAHFINLPVLIISGLNMKEEILGDNPFIHDGETQFVEPQGYIEKPIDIDNFVNLANKLTGKN